MELNSLASELAQLRLNLKERAVEPEHDMAVGSIAEAEQAAKEGDGPRALRHLKTAGKWTLDVATSIGKTVAAEAIKASLGM